MSASPDPAAAVRSLFESCRLGDRDAVRALVARLGNTEVRSPEGWTPLVVAAFHNQVELARDLLDLGADVNATNAKGTSVLMYSKSAALRTGDFAIMELLLSRGADPGHRDGFGKDILDYSRELGATELVAYLESRRGG